MKEAKWLICDDPRMLIGELLLRCPTQWTNRKLRLFACGCLRRTAWLMRLTRAEETVAAAEEHADGRGTTDLWNSVAQMATGADKGHPYYRHIRDGLLADGLTNSEPVLAATSMLAWMGKQKTRVAGLVDACEILRELAGNPFRPVNVAPEWRTDTATKLARRMYDDREFSAMPILADALQDAGCDRAEVLDHCRGPGPHVRGCWVCDLVLGKE